MPPVRPSSLISALHRRRRSQRIKQQKTNHMKRRKRRRRRNERKLIEMVGWNGADERKEKNILFLLLLLLLVCNCVIILHAHCTALIGQSVGTRDKKTKSSAFSFSAPQTKKEETTKYKKCVARSGFFHSNLQSQSPSFRCTRNFAHLSRALSKWLVGWLVGCTSYQVIIR